MCHVCNLVFSPNILYMFDMMNTCSRNFFNNSDTNLGKLSPVSSVKIFYTSVPSPWENSQEKKKGLMESKNKLLC